MLHESPAASTAASLVAARFPQALTALLTGSVARGMGTPTSDLDILVVLDGPPAPYRETLRHDGWLVELFVHTHGSLHEFYEQERVAGRCTLAHMITTGRVLVGPQEALALRTEAQTLVDNGPEPLTVPERDGRRYAITSSLDDLTDATDPDERDFIAGQLMTEAADLALRVHQRWSGTGKWLLRLLRQWDAEVALRLTQAHRMAVATGEIDDLVVAVDSVLDLAGGRLSEGYAIRSSDSHDASTKR